MEVLNKNKKGVRISIGTYEKGFTGLKKPIKTITILNTTVKEIYNKLIKFLKKEC